MENGADCKGESAVLPAQGETDKTLEEPVNQLTLTALKEVSAVINADYQDSYLASLFKNATRCRVLASRVAPPPFDRDAVDAGNV